jgi:hypothetical protein
MPGMTFEVKYFGLKLNLSRLMILGLLTERGPMHGHQIRRAGELANAEVWGGITGGALYAELRKLSGKRACYLGGARLAYRPQSIAPAKPQLALFSLI